MRFEVTITARGIDGDSAEEAVYRLIEKLAEAKAIPTQGLLVNEKAQDEILAYVVVSASR